MPVHFHFLLFINILRTCKDGLFELKLPSILAQINIFFYLNVRCHDMQEECESNGSLYSQSCIESCLDETEHYE
jgi:hypothetical protein